MDWNTILLTASGLLNATFITTILMRLFFKSERRKADAEASDAIARAQAEENRMWHDRLAEQREAVKDLNAIIADLTEGRKALEAENADKTKHIRKLNEKHEKTILDYEHRLAAKDRFISWLKLWHCAREDNNKKEGCGRRLPKQPFPMAYNPPGEIKDMLDGSDAGTGSGEKDADWEDPEKKETISVNINTVQ